MLAALLLNLGDVVREEGNVKGGADFVNIIFGDREEEITVSEAAARIEDLLGGLKKPETNAPSKAKIKRVTKKVVQALTAPEIDLAKFSDAQANLGILLFELRQSVELVADAFDPSAEMRWREMIAYLRALEVLLDEEEALIALLLA